MLNQPLCISDFKALQLDCMWALQAQQGRALHPLNRTGSTSPGSSMDACSIMPMPFRTMRRLPS